MRPVIYPYKTIGDITLLAHVFMPNGAKPDQPCPVVLFFFCGGWNNYDPVQFYPHSEYLASRGMACVNADVRTLKRHGVTPIECIVDAKSAVRWTRKNAAEFEFDSNKVAVGGGSSAAQAAFLTVVDNEYEDPTDPIGVSHIPDALLLFNPDIDPTHRPKDIDYFGTVERAREFAPINLVRSGMPPILIMQGDVDKLTPLNYAIKFKKQTVAVGSRCDLKIYQGKRHGFFNYKEKTPMFKQTLKDCDRFFESIGWLSGNQTVDTFHQTLLG